MERKRISFAAKVKPVEKINDEFLKVKLYVCALGKNRNLSHISKEAAEDAKYSLYNIPIIGFLYEDENGEVHMGGHEVKLNKTKDGKYVYKSLCVPYGVVPQQDDVHYEDIKEPNGDIKTYIVCDGILWIGRFSELLDAVYSEDWLFSQSMEINVEQYAPLEEDKNYVDLKKYSYSALCLLGKSDDEEYNVEPCFPESHVSVEYGVGEDDRFSKLMAEFKKDLSECFSEKYSGKEEEVKMTTEIRDAILAEFNVTLESIGFEITDEMTEEELRAKLAELVEEAEAEPADGEPEGKPENADPESAEETSEVQPEEVGESGEEPAGEPEGETNYQFTYREKAEALSNAMPNSNNVYYWVCDFDEKYVYVERTSYDENGDYSEERGRYEYSYDESNKTAELTGEFETMYVRWLTKTEADQIDALRGSYEELKAYKEKREKEDRDAEFNAALEEFPELNGNNEFAELVNNIDSYESVEAVKNVCYMIRGKYGIAPKTHKNSEPSVPVGAPKEPLTPRERLHAEYGRR